MPQPRRILPFINGKSGIRRRFFILHCLRVLPSAGGARNLMPSAVGGGEFQKRKRRLRAQFKICRRFGRGPPKVENLAKCLLPGLPAEWGWGHHTKGRYGGGYFLGMSRGWIDSLPDILKSGKRLLCNLWGRRQRFALWKSFRGIPTNVGPAFFPKRHDCFPKRICQAELKMPRWICMCFDAEERI